MLTLVKVSGDSKTGKIAVTYRAGINLFGTCPTTCALNPAKDTSAVDIDFHYMDTVGAAVPVGGLAWTYTHFHWSQWKDRAATYGTTFNYSADSFADAKRAVEAGVPTTVVVPEHWHGVDSKVRVVDGIRYVQCPATVAKNIGKVTCSGKGSERGCGGDNPLCNRRGDERDYVITFPVHGVFKKKANGEACYAAGGKVRLAWERTKAKPQSNDAADLAAWVAKLPHGTMLRHHVAGDVGLAY